MTRQEAPGIARTTRTPVLIALGRAALVMAPVLWATGALLGPDLTEPDPGKPYVVTALCLGFVSPWLLLPVGTTSHATLRGSTLSVVTVLGTRHVDLDDLHRIGALTVHWKTGRDRYAYLRGPGLRVAWVLLEDSSSLAGRVRGHLVRTSMARPGVVTARGRALLGVDPVPGRLRRLAQESCAFAVGFPLVVCWAGAVAYVLTRGVAL